MANSSRIFRCHFRLRIRVKPDFFLSKQTLVRTLGRQQMIRRLLLGELVFPAEVSQRGFATTLQNRPDNTLGKDVKVNGFPGLAAFNLKML